MPTLTMNFEAGTTGEVEFINRYFRFDTVGNQISAPSTQTEPIVSSSVVVDLVSGVDPDVVPNPWAWIAKIRVTGQREHLMFFTMPMGDANFVDIAQADEPATPEYYVLKSDFLNHVDAIDNPVSHGEVDAAVAVETTRAEAAEDGLQTDIDAEVARATDAEADEVARATAAEDALDSRLDDEEAATVDADGRLDDLEAADIAFDSRLDSDEADIASVTADLAQEVIDRGADVDAEQTRAQGAESTLTTNLANEVTNRTADVDAEEARALAAEALLAPKASPTFTGDPKAPTATAGDNDTSIATTAFVHGEVASEASARTTAIGVETTARIADVDAEETRALAAEALLAPKASPAFTGNPTAPSPTAGDNDTSIATTQFVTGAIATAIAALINGAPGALDTLKELADAINDDASFAATVTAALALKINAAVLTTDGDLLTRIAGVPARLTRAGLASDTAFSSVYETIANVALKANIASPTFTGDPKSVTPAQGDNDTSIATTAYVQTELGFYIPKSLLTTKGDIVMRSSTVPVRHGVGADGTFLVADSAQSDGWNNRVLAYTDMWTLPRCTVSGSAQTITTGTGGTLLTSLTESIDTHGFHSDVTNSGRITIPAGLGGTYLVMPKISWQTSSGVGIRRVNIDINAGSITNTLYVLPAAASSAMNFGLTAIVTLAAGDFMQMEVVHTQGANLTATCSEWTAIRIGP